MQYAPMLKFVKMHGVGNDFVIVDLRNGTPMPPKAKIAALTDRQTGIGCDQFITIEKPKDSKVTAYMGIYNAPDASEAEACGNATRCVADILMRESGKDRVVIQTVVGFLECWREKDGRITADMGIPKFGWKDIPLAKEVDTLHLGIGEGGVKDPVGVSMGNPHAVFFVGDVENLDLQHLGPRFETDPLFPRKANIEFVQVKSPTELRMRVWERDAGETMACGSGACATHVAAVRRGLAECKARVIVNGGSLDFHWRESDDHILMTGAVATVFDGIIKDL